MDVVEIGTGNLLKESLERSLRIRRQKPPSINGLSESGALT